MTDEEKEFHSLTRMEQLRIAEQHIAKLEAQLAAEREKVQTLVDALTEIANSNEDSQYLSRVAEDALAKVK